jgi:hypothetical protein
MAKWLNGYSSFITHKFLPRVKKCLFLTDSERAIKFSYKAF